MLTIEIDGKPIQVPTGSTIMDAARQDGAYIPHFCYHKKLSIAANCRMCLVEVEKAPKPQPACATPVADGMKVFTHSKLARNAQKAVMEFLLLNHPLDCPVCDQGGECQLQDLAMGYGSYVTRFTEAKHVAVPKNVSPLISTHEMSRCIHCTRCVRFGQEVAGIMELGMINRNVHSEIQTFDGRTVDSELSGNMIDLCPVGALTSKPFRYLARSWELSRRRSISPHDGLGSNLVVQTKNNRVVRVLPRENEAINECWLSDKDRFSYEGLSSTERLVKPMIRVDGALREVSWSAALDYVAHALNDIAITHGANQIASLGSPHATLEELYLLQKLTRGLGSGSIDFRPRRRDFSLDGQHEGIPWLGLKLAEIGELDAVLVIGSFLRKDHPLFAQRLRKLAKKSGKVSLLSVTKDNPLINLHAQKVVRPDELCVSLEELVKAVAQIKGTPVPQSLENLNVCQTSYSIAKSLTSGSRQAIFLGNSCEQSPQAAKLHSLANELAKMIGGCFGFIGEAANSVGGYVAKALPSALNAYEMFAQPRKAYILMGIEPELDCHNPRMATTAIKSAEFTVMLSSFVSSEALDYADALLPTAPFTETSGTFINTEGRVQSFHGICPPIQDARPAWKVLRALGNLLNLPGFLYDSSEEIRDELGVSPDSFVASLDNGLKKAVVANAVNQRVSANELQRIADVPIYFADPLVRRAKSLQKTKDSEVPSAYLNTATSAQLDLSEGVAVRVVQGEGEVLLTIRVDDSVPTGCVKIAASHPSTSALGDMFGALIMERA